jgi:hypothetical protein
MSDKKYIGFCRHESTKQRPTKLISQMTNRDKVFKNLVSYDYSSQNIGSRDC